MKRRERGSDLYVEDQIPGTITAMATTPGCPAKIRVEVNPMTDYDAQITTHTYRYQYHHRHLNFINQIISHKHTQTQTHIVYISSSFSVLRVVNCS